MNSSLEISNLDDLLTHLALCVNRTADKGWRATVIIAGPATGFLERLAMYYRCTFIDADSTMDRSDRITSLLGSERRMATLQLGHKPDLGLLAAVSGTLTAGGLLLVGTHHPASPQDAQDIGDCSDDLANGLANSTKRVESLASIMSVSNQEHFRLVHLAPDMDVSDQAFAKHSEQFFRPTLFHQNPLVSHPKAVAEQDAMLNAALSHQQEHTRSCIAIHGKRGRGKSTLLARLAAHLDHLELDFHVTAFHESALTAMQTHAKHAALRYLSPEKAANSPINILLVDEASSFPLHFLQKYFAHCRHVVLCTTVEGYEASGRAFTMRILANWTNIAMPLLQLEPQQPWRWANGDPLDTFICQLLLSTPQTPTPLASGNKPDRAQKLDTDWELSQIMQSELIANENLLASVYSLLYETHYQTTSKDLEHLLDAPTLQLWVQKNQSTVLAVLILEQEGLINSELHTPILTKARRLPNQLLPQLLAQTANDDSALDQRYARVIRICVQPQYRRAGLASRLLDKVTQSLTSKDDSATGQSRKATSAIGASFADDMASTAFWKSQGYCIFHRGFRANPRTGKRAVAVMRCFTSTTDVVLQRAVDIHTDNERTRSTQMPDLNSPENLSKLDTQLLRRFAAGQRSQHDTLAALHRFATLHTPWLKISHENASKLRDEVHHWLDNNVQT